MFRGVLFCLLFASFSNGETLDEAVHALAKKISIRLTPGDLPRVTVRNLSSLSNTEAARARATLERTLRTAVTPKPGAHPVELVFTVSQNLYGYLLVGELRRDDDSIVEMSSYLPDAESNAVMQASLTKHVLWEQDLPILDLVVTGDHMLILEPQALSVWARIPDGWQRAESHPLEGVAVVRDPRGRLVVAESSVAAYFPGMTCRGTWMPTVEIHCDATPANFPLGGEQVRFTPARNTMEADGWTPFFSFARIDENGRPLWLVAHADDRTHIYDAERKPAGAIDSWGDNFVVVENVCAAGRQILADSPDETNAADSLAAFALVDRKPVETSEPAEMPGPVTALWPAQDGALAVVKNASSGRYAAYHIAVDCSR